MAWKLFKTIIIIFKCLALPCSVIGITDTVRSILQIEIVWPKLRIIWRLKPLLFHKTYRGKQNHREETCAITMHKGLMDCVYCTLYTLSVRKHLQDQVLSVFTALEKVMHTFFSSRLLQFIVFRSQSRDTLAFNWYKPQLRLLTRTERREHDTPILASLHWFPIEYSSPLCC